MESKSNTYSVPDNIPTEIIIQAILLQEKFEARLDDVLGVFNPVDVTYFIAVAGGNVDLAEFGFVLD